jgi:hypothetical protein
MTEENGNLIEDLIASPIVFEVPEAVTNFPKSLLITAMMNVGGNVSITTVTPHALAVGDHVLIQGFTYENHNGRFEVIEISSTTTYTICKSYVGNVPVSFTSENSSKESFLYDGVTRLIDVKTSSVKLKNRISDKLIAYKLNFEYSNKDRVQK